MADSDTIEKPPEDTGGLDVSSALTAKPSELEPPKSVTPPPPPKLATEPYKPQAPEIGRELTTELKEAKTRAGRTADELEASVRREIELRRQEREQTRPAREAVVKDIDEELKFRREHQPQPPAPLPPRPRLKYDLRELIGPPGSNKLGNQLMDVASVFAALSGGTMQDRMIIMLKAYTGMVDGWAQGKQERFKENYDAWRDEIANIRETEQRQNKYINDVLNNSKESMALKMTRLQMLGTETKDAILAESAYRQDITNIEKIRDSKLAIGEKLFSIAEKMDKDVRAQERDISDDALLRRVNMMLEGLPASQYQRGIRAGSEDEKRFSELVDSEMTRRGMSAQDLEKKQFEYAGGLSGARTQANVAQRTLTQLDIIERRLQTLIPDVYAASEALPRGRWVMVNEAVQAFQRGTSDPRLYAFGQANFDLAETYAKAKNPTGTLQIGLQNFALERLNTATSRQAYATVLNQIVREIYRSIQAARDEVSGAPVQLPNIPGAYVPPGQAPLPGVSTAPAITGTTSGGINWSLTPGR